MGWVLRDAVGPIDYGTVELNPSTDLSVHLRSMDEPLGQLIRACTYIAVEKPNTANSAYFAVRKNMAALGHIHYWAGFYGIRIPPENEINLMTAKLTFSGNGAAKKPLMIRTAQERYGLDMNEHEADALAISEVYLFGAREPIRKARSRSSKGVVVQP